MFAMFVATLAEALPNFVGILKTNFTDNPEFSAECRKSEENRMKNWTIIRFELDLS